MFCLMQPLAGLCDCKPSATFLIFVGLVAADTLVWNMHEIPGMVHEANQQQAFAQACGWVEDLGCDADCCLLMEKPMGKSRARVVVHYG